jgi:hypothetical protein
VGVGSAVAVAVASVAFQARGDVKVCEGSKVSMTCRQNIRVLLCRRMGELIRAHAVRAFVLLVLLCIWTPRTHAHPKPGAHADVRITIDEDAVRFHVAMNLLFVDQIVNSSRAARDEVTDDEAADLREAVAEYFGAAGPAVGTHLVDRPNRVKIDGIDVTPLVKDLRVVRPEPESRPGFVQNPALLIPQIYAELEYRCTTAPRSVSLAWGSYPRDFVSPDRIGQDTAPITDIEAVLIAFGTMELLTFKKQEPEYTWHVPAAGARRAPLAVPAMVRDAGMRIPALSIGVGVLWLTWAARLLIGKVRTQAGNSMPGVSARTFALGTLACAGLAAAVSPIARVGVPGLGGQSGPAAPASLDEAQAIFAPLHANIYRAFDFTRESDIYDALARSVDGPLLDSVYNDVYQSLILREEGGALCRVRQVTPLATSLGASHAKPESPAFAVTARWQVEGVVYHWGHSHTRTNEYEAEYVIAPAMDGWRIVAAHPISQRRIQTPEQAASEASADARADEGARTNDAAVQQPSGGTWRPDR